MPSSGTGGTVAGAKLPKIHTIMAKVLWVLKQSLAKRLHVYPIAHDPRLAGHGNCIQLTPKDHIHHLSDT